jgi:RNA polymerase sigma-70 factor (ECF subfamily)
MIDEAKAPFQNIPGLLWKLDSVFEASKKPGKEGKPAPGQGITFEELVQRYELRLYRFILNIVHEVELARDLTQDTFFLAYRFLSQHAETDTANLLAEEPDRVASWLFTIARNVALGELRRRKRVRFLSFWAKTNSSEGTQDESELLDYFASSHLSQNLEAQVALHDQLCEAFKGVKPQMLASLLLHFNGFSYEEISLRTGFSQVKIKSQVFRARARLRELLTYTP